MFSAFHAIKMVEGRIRTLSPGSEVLPERETSDDAALVVAVRRGSGEALGELFRRSVSVADR